MYVQLNHNGHVGVDEVVKACRARGVLYRLVRPADKAAFKASLPRPRAALGGVES